MKVNLLTIGLFMFSFLLLTSCGKDDNDVEVSGSYNLTSIKFENCDDPEENLSLEFDENGCIMEQGIEVCVVGDMSFNNGNYTISLDVTFGGASFGDSQTDTGTYTIEGNNITLCSGGTDCQEAKISINGDILTLSEFMDEDGCDQTLVAKKG